MQKYLIKCEQEPFTFIVEKSGFLLSTLLTIQLLADIFMMIHTYYDVMSKKLVLLRIQWKRLDYSKGRVQKEQRNSGQE